MVTVVPPSTLELTVPHLTAAWQKPNCWVIIHVPTVLRSRGFEIRIYLPPREHGPAHVHVMKGETEVIIRLAHGGRAQELRRSDMRPSDMAKAMSLVAAKTEFLLQMWKRLHDEATETE